MRKSPFYVTIAMDDMGEAGCSFIPLSIPSPITPSHSPAAEVPVWRYRQPYPCAARPALGALGLFFVCAAIWPKPVTTGRAVMVAGSLAFMAQYAWWRIIETLPAPAFNFEYASLVFLAAELVGILTAALSLMFLIRTRDRSPEADANADWLPSRAKPPSIDVLICSYNEEKEILERTIVGALGMDYPKFRVWILDDSRRDWVKTLCADLGCRYLSRSDNAHAKAET